MCQLRRSSDVSVVPGAASSAPGVQQRSSAAGATPAPDASCPAPGAPTPESTPEEYNLISRTGPQWHDLNTTTRPL